MGDMPGKGIGHFVGAMRIDGFRPVEDFKAHMDQWISRFKSAETIKGQEEVIIPGEPEAELYTQRQKDGIPLIHDVYTDLKNLCNELEIQFTI